MNLSMRILFYVPCLLVNAVAIAVCVFSENARRDRLTKDVARFLAGFFAYFLLDFLIYYVLRNFFGFDAEVGTVSAGAVRKLSPLLFLALLADKLAQFYLIYALALLFLGLCSLDKSRQRRFLIGLPIFTLALWTSALIVFFPLLEAGTGDAPSGIEKLSKFSSIACLFGLAVVSAGIVALWLRKRGSLAAGRRRRLGDILGIVVCSYFPLVQIVGLFADRIVPDWRLSSMTFLLASPFAVNLLSCLAVILYYSDRPLPAGEAAAVPAAADPFAPFALTPRETEIARLITQGLSNKEICQILGISHGTVKNHVFAIFRKVGVQSRFELMRYAPPRPGPGSE
jgi:DNA-binding CsgD family transcriptional regulator